MQFNVLHQPPGLHHLFAQTVLVAMLVRPFHSIFLSSRVICSGEECLLHNHGALLMHAAAMSAQPHQQEKNCHQSAEGRWTGGIAHPSSCCLAALYVHRVCEMPGKCLHGSHTCSNTVTSAPTASTTTERVPCLEVHCCTLCSQDDKRDRDTAAKQHGSLVSL